VIPIEETTGESKIQVVHAAPGTSGIKLWQNGSTAQDVGRYYKSNTHYFPIQAGYTKLDIKRSSNNIPLTSLSTTLVPGAHYSLFVCDSPSRLTPVLVQDQPLPMREDKAQLRIVNLLSSGESIDLMLNEDAFFKNVVYKGASSYVYVEPGAIKFMLRQSGSMKSLIPNLEYWLDAGSIYTIYVNGFSYLTGAAGTDAILMANL
jgi:hypothetical protein